MQQAVLLRKKYMYVTVKSNKFILPADFPLGSHEKFSELSLVL
jgi:hypothetical protein